MVDADFVIAIPTFRRTDVLKECTLPLLSRMSVPAVKIYVFVANESEHVAYEKCLDKTTYHKLVTGCPGLGAQRNFIAHYFESGQLIVHIDDDVTRLLDHTNTHVTDVNQWVRLGFQLCEQHACKAWGVYPVDNRLCMSETATVGWVPLIGCIYGVVNTRDDALMQTCDNCEDLERTLKHIAHIGGVVRLNGICFRAKSKHFGTGGLGKGPERLLDYEVQLQKLEKTYTSFIARRVKKKRFGDWLAFKRSPTQRRVPVNIHDV